MIIVRYLLVTLIVYLLIRSFIRYGNDNEPGKQKVDPEAGKRENKKISKNLGEYIDYEEINKKDL